MQPVTAFALVDWVCQLWDYLRGVNDLPGWITAVVLVVTAIFALRALWDARRTRHGQLITEIQRQWTEPDILAAIELQRIFKAERIAQLVDTMFGPDTDKATKEDEEAWNTLAPWPNHIEAMGVLCNVKAITPKVVYKMWGGAILEAWENWELAVMRIRIHDKAPDSFYYFEKLAGKLEKIARRRGGAPRGVERSCPQDEDRGEAAAEPDSQEPHSS
jgi:hypothetical protein